MALPVAVYELRDTATANNVNGAGFNAARGGTDYTLQDAAQETRTDLTCTAASTTVTSAAATFTDAMKGNFIHLTALTGTGAIVGWYEIVSVTDANNLVLDRTPTNGVNNITAGTFYVGGAGRLGALDDPFFELPLAGSTIWIKKGTYTLAGNVIVANDATTAEGILYKGYNATRGDNPTGTDRPTIDCNTRIVTVAGLYYNFEHIMFTSSHAAGVNVSTGTRLENCKFTNTGSGVALTLTATANKVIRCEMTSAGGTAVDVNNLSNLIHGCYIHDSDVGVNLDAFDNLTFSFNVIDNCTTGILLDDGSINSMFINNTFYGAETPAGTAVSIGTAAATSVNNVFLNNIFYGWTTGVNIFSVTSSNAFLYNNFYNNTTDTVNVTLTSGNLTLNPQFTNAGSGDFSIGTNLKAAATPGNAGQVSTSYLDMGAVQRQEQAASTPSSDWIINH